MFRWASASLEVSGKEKFPGLPVPRLNFGSSVGWGAWARVTTNYVNDEKSKYCNPPATKPSALKFGPPPVTKVKVK